MEPWIADSVFQLKYDGNNYRQWKIAFDIEFKFIELTTTHSDEDMKKEMIEAKGMRLILWMLSKDKICVLEGITSVKEALLKIEEEQAILFPTIRSLFYLELDSIKYEGTGKIKKYLSKLDDVVARFRNAGGTYQDTEIIMRIFKGLPSYLVIIICSLTETSTLLEVKWKLIEADEIQEKREPQKNQKSNSRDSASEIAKLNAKIVALSGQLNELRTASQSQAQNSKKDCGLYRK